MEEAQPIPNHQSMSQVKLEPYSHSMIVCFLWLFCLCNVVYNNLQSTSDEIC